MTNKIMSMFSRITAQCLKPAFAIIAVFLAVLTSKAGDTWKSDVTSGNWEDVSSWNDGTAFNNDHNVVFASSPTVFFNQANSINYGMWIENGSITTPVVWKLANEAAEGAGVSIGVTYWNAEWQDSLTIGTGTAGGLKIESGTYSLARTLLIANASAAPKSVFEMTGGSMTAGWDVKVAQGDNSSAKVSLSGNQYFETGYFVASVGTSSTTEMEITGGTWKNRLDAQLSYGQGSTSSLSVSGNPTITCNFFDLAFGTSSDSDVAIYGGNVSSALDVRLGVGEKSTADLTISGGSISSVYETTVGKGSEAEAELTISGSAEVSVGRNLVLAEQSNGTGTVNLNGGTLGVGGSISATGKGTIKLNGTGVIALNAADPADNYNFIDSSVVLNAGENGGTLYVKDGGRLIAVNAKLTGSGEIRKTGTRPLTFANADFTDFTGTFKLNAGTLILPNAYTGTVSTDVVGYEATPTIGETTTTYTLAKIPVTWEGDEDSNWNTPGNWDGGAVPTASDDVVIPANATVTLTSAPDAVASITAPSSVTITMESSAYAKNLTTVLQNTAWQGTLQFNNDTAYQSKNSGYQFDLQDYGNANSIVEYCGNSFVSRFRNGDADTKFFAGSLKVSGVLEMSQGNADGSKRSASQTEISRLSGSGTWNLGGWVNSDSGYHHHYKLDDISGFTGTFALVSTYNVAVVVGAGTYAANTIDFGANHTFGAGVTFSASSGITMGAKIFTLSGNANFASSTTIASGATFNYAALGTVAFAVVPTLSGTVTINIPAGVTPSDVDTTLMTWKQEGESAQTITADKFTLSGSLDSEDYELKVVDRSRLVLHDKNPPYMVYVNGDAAYSYNTLTEAIAKAVELGAYDYVYATKSDSASVTKADATGLKIKTADDEVSVIISLSDTVEYSALAGDADENGVVTYTTQNAATTYTWAADEDGIWSVAPNWTFGEGVTATRAPADGDTVTIGGYKVTFDGSSAVTLAGLTVNSSLEIGDIALWTDENALTVDGAGWVKFNGSNSSAYSAATISVPDGTLEFAAGSTFKDIAAGTVYVNGTVTGTTLDAEGNIGNGSTLFTLTNGTFANATVTAYINGTDTAIHYTNTAGEYTAGKVFYWTLTTTTNATNFDVPNNWYLDSNHSSIASYCPSALDTAVFATENAAADCNSCSALLYNIVVEKSFKFEHNTGDTSTRWIVGRNEEPKTTIFIKSGATATLINDQPSFKTELRGNVFGSGVLLMANASGRSTCEGTLNADVTSFKGTLKFVTTKKSGIATQNSQYISDQASDGSLAAWSVFEDEVQPMYTAFSGESSEYKFGSLKMFAYSRTPNGKAADSASIVTHLATFTVGGRKEDSRIWGTWPATYKPTVNWIDTTATFTQEAANTAALNITGGGFAYVAKNATEGSEANFVPGSIKFLDNGGYLTIDDDNAAIAGDIVNAIAAAGTGETQAVAGFNVTAAEGVTAAVANWSALAASGITKKGDGTLTLTGTPQAYTGTTTVEAGALVMPASAEATLTLGANTIVSARDANTITLAKATTVTGLAHEHATATVTAGGESVPVTDGTAAVPVGSNVVITWTAASGYQITGGESQEISNIREAVVATEPTVSELPTVSIAAPKVGAYGNDFATVSVTAGVTSTYPAATEITYTLRANGTAIATTTAAGDATSVTFGNANVSGLTRYDNISYTVEASGDNVTAATSGATTAMLADAEGWIDEKKSTTGTTGSWKTTDGADATVTYDNETERAELSDNKFSANNCSTGDVVTVTIKDVIYTALSDTSTVDGDAQGSIALGGTEDAPKFMVLTKSGDKVQWSEAEGVNPALNTSYTIVFKFDYTSNTYSITVNGTALTVGGSATYDIVKTTNKYVKDIDFLGAGSIKAIEGIQYDAMMAVDQDGVRYATVAEALDRNKSVKGAIIKLLHGTANTNIAGWNYNADTKTFIKKAVGLIFLAF